MNHIDNVNGQHLKPSHCELIEKAKDVDQLVAKRLKEERLERNMTQIELARRIGITFQQIQKYEKGTNRIGAGRLKTIADVLGVSPLCFFEEPKEYEKFMNASAVKITTEQEQRCSPPLCEREGRMLQALSQIEDNEMKSKIISVVESMVMAMRNS